MWGVGRGAAGFGARPGKLCVSWIIYTQEGKLPWSLGPPADKTHKDKRLGGLECVCVGGGGDSIITPEARGPAPQPGTWAASLPLQGRVSPLPASLPPPAWLRLSLPPSLPFSASLSCLSLSPPSLCLSSPRLRPPHFSLSVPPTQYYEMSYGLNIEMHKQAEIVKRLNGICAQVLPYLSQEHQQQVLGAIERAKQVTAPELNSIIRQQLQAHQLSQLQALALPLTPLPVGLQPPSLPAVSAGTGLLSLSALGSQAHLSKEDKNGHDGDTHQEDDGDKSD
uniref:TLE family member 5, transcriptional modulator n=1 Tax=Equus asinus asinus TaxID=83772 RepID=A0A8C4MXK8_EQUAS